MADAAERSAEFDDEVDRLANEGLMIARSVLRMRVKNRIIVEVMGKQQRLPRSHYDELVLTEIDRLADESDAAAERLAATRKLVRTKGSQAYRGNPAENLDPESLQLRSDAEAALAKLLRSQRDDEQFRSELATQARQDAMDEMFRARMLQDTAIPPDQDDPVDRKDRLMGLVDELRRGARRHEIRQRRRERWARLTAPLRSLFGLKPER